VRVPPALVLLHGFTQTRQSWRRTIGALDGRYRAVAPDLLGHGLMSERAARQRSDAALADRIEQIGVEAFAAEWAELPLWEGQPERVRAAANADRLRNTPGGLAAALRGLGTGALPSLWDRLAELAMPVTLIAGERDAKFREIAERMAERLPDARIELIPGAGHAAHLERPELVAAKL
jgi:pimeloyl-ACP methyl ester carboxylesterase